MKHNPWLQYEERLKRVCTYIHEHLDDELDMDKLAEIACLSAWHWHRIYRAVLGETAVATIKRLRLHRAATELALSDVSLTQIAKRAGYPNIQSFTRTFGKAYGQSPAQYRNSGGHASYRQAIEKGLPLMFDVKIKNLEAIRVIGLKHSGSYMDIGRTYTELWQLLKTRNIGIPGMIGVAIYYDDPDITAIDELSSFAGVSATADMPAAPPLTEQQVAGGEHAVLLFTGPYAGLYSAYQWLFKTWLPGSGRSVGRAPAHEVYLNNPADTPPNELLTEIRLPLEPF